MTKHSSKSFIGAALKHALSPLFIALFSLSAQADTVNQILFKGVSNAASANPTVPWPTNNDPNPLFTLSVLVPSGCPVSASGSTGTTLATVVNAVNCLAGTFTTTVNTVMTYFSTKLDAFDSLYSTAAEVANTNYQTQITDSATQKLVDDKVLEKMNFVLTQNQAAQQAQGMALFVQAVGAPPATNSTQRYNDAVKNLDWGSVINPTFYPDTTALNYAQHAIWFASDFASPLTSLEAQLTSDQRKQLSSSPAGQAYQVDVGGLAALRSIALDNLYYIYTQRVAINDLGKDAGLPNNVKDASPMQVEEYIATRRTADPTWYTNMNTAPQPIVARETLLVLAEMERMLYQLHRDNERILAALTAVEVQGLRAQKMFPSETEKNARSALGLDQTGPGTDLTKSISQTPTTTNTQQK